MAKKNEMFGQGCGCRIQGHGLVITYCPMHRAAPVMLAALELLVEADVTEWSRDAVNKALAAARGQEVGAC